MYPREREKSRAETGLRIEKERKGERTTSEEEDGHGEVERRGDEWGAGNEGSYNRYSSGTRESWMARAPRAVAAVGRAPESLQSG